MCSFISDLQLPFKNLHPLAHQMNILQEDPATMLSVIIQCLLCCRLLTLPHADVPKLFVFDREALLLQDRLDILDYISTRE